MADVSNDQLPVLFDALLSMLESRLTDNQLWELQIHVEYEALDAAFDLLCSMLREVRGPRQLLSSETRELLEKVGLTLGVDEAQWRDIA